MSSLLKSKSISTSHFSQTQFEAQIVIIGLGIAGLSAAYQLSKHGYSVVGVEQFCDSGMIGTASCSQTRAFKSATDAFPGLQLRQAFDISEWKNLQYLSQTSIIEKVVGGVDVGPIGSKEMNRIEEFMKSKPNIKLTAQQVNLMYPAIRVPDNYYAVRRDDQYIIDVKNALKALRNGAQAYGARFIYNSKMKSFDVSKKQVICQEKRFLKKQQKIITKVKTFKYLNSLVMTMGGYTQEFNKFDKQVKYLEVEIVTIKDSYGMPPMLTFYTSSDDSQKVDGYFYQMPFDPLSKDNIQKGNYGMMKFGLSGQRNFMKFLQTLQKFFPTKKQQIGLITPCFKTVRASRDDFKIYRDKDGIIWCFAFSGQGFKHGPSIGMNVVDLVKRSHIQPKL